MEVILEQYTIDKLKHKRDVLRIKKEEDTDLLRRYECETRPEYAEFLQALRRRINTRAGEIHVIEAEIHKRECKAKLTPFHNKE